MSSSKSTIVPERYDRQFVQGLIDRIAALERGYYQRGQDVLIGTPQDVARQATRVPRLILVDPTNGRQYYADPTGGTLTLVAL